jgi:uncharacterized protein (TIGR03000 family)
MRNRIFLSAVLGALVLLGTAGAASAQHRGHGGHDGYRGGYYHSGYGGWYGGPRFSVGIYAGYPYSSYYYSPYRYGYAWPYTYYEYPGYTYSYSEPAYSDSYYYAPPPPVTTAAATGRIRVVLPNPDAQLWIENVAMRQLGSDRTFATPPLERGKTYTYHLRARWMEGDREVSKDRQVTVRAGEEAMVNFRDVATNVP